MPKKRGKKEMDQADEMEYLIKGIRQANTKGDFKELASLHNQLGNIYRQRGEFTNALEQHMEEGQISLKHNPNDKISLAIAYRNIGECHIDMKKEEKAAKYIKRYLTLAARERNLVEEQRAHITLGRISLSLIDKYTDNEANDPLAHVKRSEELETAKRQFTRANEILSAGTINGVVKDKELAEMKCGTYLNLGITYDLKDDPAEAVRWMEKSVSLAVYHGLTDTLHRCHCAMYTTLVKMEKVKEAYETSKQVYKVAKVLGNKVTLAEARILEARALFLLNEMEKGVNVLKRIRKEIKKKETMSNLLEELDPLLIAGVRILKAEDEYYESDKKDKLKLKSYFELKGDNYVTLGNFREAIKSYQESIKNAEKFGLKGKPLAALYYSLGATYKDRGDYSNALKYFQKEIEIFEGNRIEEFRTQTNITECLEKGNRSKEDIIAAHNKAIELSEDFPKKQITAFRSLSSYYKGISSNELAEKYSKKADDLTKLLKPKSSQSTDVLEDDSQELDLSDDIESIDLDDLSSAGSESEDEEGDSDQAKNVVSCKPLKMQRNEKGETRLHVESQKGNVKAVRRLIAQGHEVNPRDYCGWIPLHEACNFGHYEVVVELLKNKASVNDMGGEKCNGVTPLHDAALNGNISVMRALLEHGANVLIKDKEGNRPIDTFVAWFESQRENKNLTEEEVEDCNEIKNCILEKMKRGGKIYTEKDEKIALRKAAKWREPSPEFSLMKTSADDLVPVKICVDPDEDEGRAGVDEYSEAISTLRRKDSRKFQQRSSRNHHRSTSRSPPKEAFLAESQYIGGDWLVTDENLAPDQSNNKRKRDPFDDCKLDDHRSTRRRKEGKRNTVAQMDFARGRVPGCEGDSDSGGESEEELVAISSSNPDSSEPVCDIFDFNDTVQVSSPLPCTSAARSPHHHTDYMESNGIEFEFTGGQDEDSITIVSDESDGDEDFQSNSSSSRQDARSSNNRLGRNTSTSSLGLSRKRQTQSKLPFKRLSNSNIDNSSLSLPQSSSSSSSASLKKQPSFSKLDLTNSSTTPLRLKIDIMGTKILVPVLEQEKTIDWLCQETANRYHKESGSGMKLTLTLMTKDGARLSGTDSIRIAISDNDTELTAKVENSTMVELHKRFESACLKASVEPVADVASALQRCESSEALILVDTCLRGSINEALFLSIKHHFCLREINLSGCSLRDDGVKKFCRTLTTLPNLEKLDLSCNGFTRDGLTIFSDVFTKHLTRKQDLNYRPPTGLQKLILSHNPLGNSITEQLAQLLKSLKNLKHFSIRDCNLTAAFFSRSKKEFLETINSCLVDTLDISFNLLGKGGLMIINTEITNTHIKIDSSFCE